MKRAFSAVLFLVIGVLVLSGCASIGFGSYYREDAVILHPHVAKTVSGKNVSISADSTKNSRTRGWGQEIASDVRGPIEVAVIAAGGRINADQASEISIVAEVSQHQSNPSQNHNSPVPLVRTYNGPSYLVRVELRVFSGGEQLYYSVGTDYGYDAASISWATRAATRQALSRLRPLR